MFLIIVVGTVGPSTLRTTVPVPAPGPLALVQAWADLLALLNAGYHTRYSVLLPVVVDTACSSGHVCGTHQRLAVVVTIAVDRRAARAVPVPAARPSAAASAALPAAANAAFVGAASAALPAAAVSPACY